MSICPYHKARIRYINGSAAITSIFRAHRSKTAAKPSSLAPPAPSAEWGRRRFFVAGQNPLSPNAQAKPQKIKDRKRQAPRGPLQFINPVLRI